MSIRRIVKAISSWSIGFGLIYSSFAYSSEIDFIKYFPKEISLHIFKYLSPVDVGHASIASPAWNDYDRNQILRKCFKPHLKYTTEAGEVKFKFLKEAGFTYVDLIEVNIERLNILGIPVDFAEIPGGTYTMGSPANEEGRFPDERQKSVTVEPFKIATTLVTQALYQNVMGNNPSENNQGGEYPVERVSHESVLEFLIKLNELNTDQTFYFDLPTEEEWEYAARAGSTGPYPFGIHDLSEYAWFADNADMQTHPVRLKRPNAWGLYDVYGLLWEQTKTKRDPEAIDKSNRIMRGGSISSSVHLLRSAARTNMPFDKGYWHLGFRFVIRKSLLSLTDKLQQDDRQKDRQQNKRRRLEQPSQLN